MGKQAVKSGVSVLTRKQKELGANTKDLEEVLEQRPFLHKVKSEG